MPKKKILVCSGTAEDDGVVIRIPLKRLVSEFKNDPDLAGFKIVDKQDFAETAAALLLNGVFDSGMLYTHVFEPLTMRLKSGEVRDGVKYIGEDPGDEPGDAPEKGV